MPTRRMQRTSRSARFFFITGRGVGRILAQTRTGDDLALTLGPVELTDVVQEAHLSGTHVAIDPSAMYSYSAPGLSGRDGR